MIEIIEGNVSAVGIRFIVVQVFSGLGLKVFTPFAANFKIGEKTKLVGYLSWNQDKGPSLFGFNSLLDKETFLSLISCPKVGPQTALQIMDNVESHTLLNYAQNQDSSSLSKINGIGPKTADNIVLGLKKKASQILLDFGQTKNQKDGISLAEVRQALSGMGYPIQKIEEALCSITIEANEQFDVILKKALKYFVTQG